MRSWTLHRYLLLALALSIPASSPAAVRNRITSAVQESNRVALAHTVAPRAMRAADLGAAPSSLPLADMMVHFSMTDAQQAALSQLLVDQQDPSSPRFHQWLTPEQFGAQFGLSADDLAKVSSWLTAQGFTVTGVAKSSTFITFSGTAAQVQHAFGTTVHSVSLDGEQHIANLSEPVLPVAIAGVVQEISGLNDFRFKPRLHKRTIRANSVHPQNTINTTTGLNHYIAPGDFYTIYGIPDPQSGSNLNGSGITIAVMGQVDLNTDALADVAAFRAASGLSANAPSIQLYGTDPGSPTASSCLGTNPPSTCDDVDESLLDVEWAGAVAPAAKILFVTSTNVIGISLAQAITNKIAPIMTVSYGNCEANFSSASITALNQLFQQANAQGITILGPAGDDGATDCDFNTTSATNGLAVDFPASSPYVTGVGGTTFNEGSGSYWNSGNGAYDGSATSYIPESVWNETALDLTSSSPGFGATGGGPSMLFAKPAWQTGTGVPNDFSRDVPDVALNAAANHDGYLVCAFGSCGTNSFVSTSGSFSVFGGTSASTPAFAGILALVEQKLGGARIGNANPMIYALANSPSYNNIFHDVQTGNNNSPCTAGSTNCPSGTTSIGFNAGPGYDQVTGWGSVDANQLANAWGSVTPTRTGAEAISNTSISTTSATVTAGASIPLTIAVTSGTVSSTATPTGTIQILLDGTSVSTTPLLAGGNATYSLATSALCGQHVVTAVYSGDVNYNSSKGTVKITVTSSTCADFTLTPTTSTINVSSGQTSTGTTFTVTAVNGFTGTVAFSSTGSINAAYTISLTSVPLTTTAPSATVTYAIQAFVPNARSSQLQLKSASNSSPTTNQQRGAPWYIAGSSSVLACFLIFVIPGRRRWGTTLMVLISVAVLSAAGCSGSQSTTGGSSGTITPTQTNTTPGNYTVQLVATGTDTTGVVVTHTSTITVVVK